MKVSLKPNKQEKKAEELASDEFKAIFRRYIRKTTTKLGLTLLLAVAGGLLLGGNAIAESGADEGAAATVVSASTDIQSYEEQAKSLAEQVKAFLAEQEPAKVEKTELTQDQLDAIEVQVKEIAAKTAVLKDEVQKFVAIRTISQQVAGLKDEVAALKLAEQSGGQPAQAEKATAEVKTEVAAQTETAPVTEGKTEVTAQTETAPDKANVEAQIAAIKAQIKDLTAEYEAQKATEEVQAAADKNAENAQCVGGVCSAKINIGSTEAQTATAQATPSKNLWQNISDFLKNLFTF